MNKLFKKLLLIVAIGLCANGTRAVLITDNLADLVANKGQLQVGDKVFSNFGVQSSMLPTFDASTIQVTASIDSSGIYYLTYSGNISLVSMTPTTGDLLLSYTVSASPGQIIMIDQNYTGSAQPAGGSFLSVDETVFSGGTIVGNSHLQVGDLSDPFAEAGDNLNIIPPQSTLAVTKDIGLGITAASSGGFVTVSSVSQSFHQTGCPDGGLTVMLLGVALVGVQSLRRKLSC